MQFYCKPSVISVMSVKRKAFDNLLSSDMHSISLFSGVADSTVCHTLCQLGGIDFCYCSSTCGAVNLEVTVPAK